MAEHSGTFTPSIPGPFSPFPSAPLTHFPPSSLRMEHDANNPASSSSVPEGSSTTAAAADVAKDSKFELSRILSTRLQAILDGESEVEMYHDEAEEVDVPGIPVLTPDTPLKLGESSLLSSLELPSSPPLLLRTTE